MHKADNLCRRFSEPKALCDWRRQTLCLLLPATACLRVWTVPTNLRRHCTHMSAMWAFPLTRREGWAPGIMGVPAGYQARSGLMKHFCYVKKKQKKKTRKASQIKRDKERWNEARPAAKVVKYGTRSQPLACPQDISKKYIPGSENMCVIPSLHMGKPSAHYELIRYTSFRNAFDFYNK